MAGREGTEGAWIFVSHSHQDLEKVRRIRNALEARGHNPILFFLKCLGDESELVDLIRREIQVRDWFILCDSPSARTSRWVQDEVETIKRLQQEALEANDARIPVILKIDLDDDLGHQLEQVTALSRRATVFIAYSREDQAVADAVRAALRRQDFAVRDTFDREFYRKRPPGTSYISAVSQAVYEAMERGFVLFLLSPESIRSKTVQMEVIDALNPKISPRRSHVVPVLVGDREATLSALSTWTSEVDRRNPGVGSYLYSALVSIIWHDLTAGDLEKRIAELIRSLKTRDMDPAAPREQ